MSTIAASGTTLIWNNTDGISVSFAGSGATITRSAGSSSGFTAYIALENPPSTTSHLSKVTGECTGSGGATIDKITVNYGGSQIYESSTDLELNTDFSFTVDKTSGVADSKPYGICITVDFKFPSASSFKLNSLGLKFVE